MFCPCTRARVSDSNSQPQVAFDILLSKWNVWRDDYVILRVNYSKKYFIIELAKNIFFSSLLFKKMGLKYN